MKKIVIIIMSIILVAIIFTPNVAADSENCSPYPECKLYTDSAPNGDEGTDQNGRKCYTRPWVCKPPID